MAAESRLATKVESFRTKKETIKAQYSAADAQVKITESVTGISEEMADVGMAVQRAEEKTENMKARSAALGRAPGIGNSDRPLRRRRDRDMSWPRSKPRAPLKMSWLK